MRVRNGTRPYLTFSKVLSKQMSFCEPSLTPSMEYWQQQLVFL